MVQAAETVYSREKIRDELSAFMGGDPRRSATAAQLRAKYGETDYRHNFAFWSAEDIRNAQGVSPDIETSKRNVQESFRRIF
jgi:hypothetical protein